MQPLFLFASVCVSLFFSLVTVPEAQAQYSARQLTRKIVPPAQQPPPRQQPQPILAPAPLVKSGTPVESDRLKTTRSDAQKKAVEYQKKRAEEGSGQAQYDLGVRYLKGDGVEKNEVLGREWLAKASKSGFSQAQKKLDELPKLEKPKAEVLPVAVPAPVAPPKP